MSKSSNEWSSVEYQPIHDGPHPHDGAWVEVPTIEAVRRVAREEAMIVLFSKSENSEFTLIPNSALRWLFGEEDDFEPPPGAGKYWWRTEFRKRIGQYDSERLGEE